MRALLILPIAFLFFTMTSCDKEDKLVKENIELDVEFIVQNAAGIPWEGVSVLMVSNKFNLLTDDPTGTPFEKNAASDINGIVYWKYNVSYNIDREEYIKVYAYATKTVNNDVYTGEATIVYTYGDSPGFPKTNNLILTKQ